MIGQRCPFVAQTLLYTWNTIFSYYIKNSPPLDSNLHQPATYLLGDHDLTILTTGADTKRLILKFIILISNIPVFLFMLYIIKMTFIALSC